MTCMQHKHMCRLMCHSLETQLGSSLLSPPGATPDVITSSHPNALANGTSLLLLLGQKSLDPESLVRRHHDGGERELSQYFLTDIEKITCHSFSLVYL